MPTDPGQPTILVVDDESAMRRVIVRFLSREGYAVLEAESGATTMAALEQHPVDLITLDLALGAENGLELAQAIRRQSDVAIIVVSGKTDIIDRVVGLEVGADDYLTKPVQLRELLARVRSVLRRTRRDPADHRPAKAKPGSRYRFAGCVLDTARRELTTGDGSCCELTTVEFNLLVAFVSHAHLVLTRDQLMDQLKGHDWHPADRSIDNNVGRLRRKLQPFCDADIIKTVRGVGYTFVRDVERER